MMSSRQTKLLRAPSFVSIDVDAKNSGASFKKINKKALTGVVKEQSHELLNQLGGVQKIVASIESNDKEGIAGSDADLARRRAVFGENKYNKLPPTSFFFFILEALKDTTIIILLLCAVLSLGFGIKQHGPNDGWYDGGSIIVAAFLVVVVSAVSNFKQSQQFEKLSQKSNDIKVQVVRKGRHLPVSIFDIVVGDVVSLKIGDQIPADGLFLEGYCLTVDESSTTGDSDHVEVNGSRNPFLLSGTKVIDGCGSMIVTSVGMNTAWVETMSFVSRDLEEQTPLQERLNKLASYIGKITLVLAVLTIRYSTGNTKDDDGIREYNGSTTKLDDGLNSVVSIIAAAVTIALVAIPEGLPPAVTLILAYSMKRMMKDKAMIRKLAACETMGSATTIT